MSLLAHFSGIGGSVRWQYSLCNSYMNLSRSNYSMYIKMKRRKGCTVYYNLGRPAPIVPNASRKHSRYGRVVKDLPFMDYKVELRVIVRRFFCDEPLCEQRIFTERDLSLFEPYSRRTARMEKSLRSTAFSTSAEQGSRLSAQMNIPVSVDTLLRLIRETSIESIQPSNAVGIDDWAYLKRQRYGVLICDLHRHRPVGLLKEFSSDAVSQWLE